MENHSDNHPSRLSRGIRRAVCAGVAIVLSAGVLFGQDSDVILSRYRKLNLPEAAGSIHVFYSHGAEQRALLYQKRLEAAVKWFSGQLGTQVPMVLAVIDKETWKETEGLDLYPLPHIVDGKGSYPSLIVCPAHIEDFPGLYKFKPDVDPNLAAEAVLFHEAGHIFASHLGIWSGNHFVNELIANVFMAGFIGAGHPEYAFMTAGVPSRVSTPRYTTLADLDYLYVAVGARNYGWFQVKLQQLAKLLVEGREFPDVVRSLKAAFPAAEKTPLPVNQVVARLEKIHPGFTKAAGVLAGPTTLPRVSPSPCLDVPPRPGDRTILIVRNRSEERLSVKTEDGRAIEIPAGEFRQIQGKSGEQVKLSGNTCLRMGSEPGLAVIN
jgi:hypothetical protein